MRGLFIISSFHVQGSPRQRVQLSLPATGRFDATAVVVIDISVLGWIRHHLPLSAAAGSANLSFELDGENVSVECRVVRSRLERFSTGATMTVYHSGLEFMDPANGRACSSSDHRSIHRARP
jgi:hypothetical protein